MSLLAAVFLVLSGAAVVSVLGQLLGVPLLLRAILSGILGLVVSFYVDGGEE